MTMASASACSSISTSNSSFLPPTSSVSPLHFHFTTINSHCLFKNFAVACTSSGVNFHKHSLLRPSKLKAVAEEQGILVPEQEQSPPPAGDASGPTASVAVSPADVLTMFFQAEGTMNDSAIPAVTNALEGIEGITDLKVRVLEGIASVELRKQTTIQATGVASNLVEAIQSSGFKLQTLNLSFQDDEDFS